MNEYSTIIGMDLGDKYSDWALMTREDGEIQEEGRVRTTEAALKRKFSAMAPARVAIEAGTHSPWISRLLEDCGHEVLVANPRKLRLIYRNEAKSDKVDARILARLARLDPELLHPIRHRGKQAQVDLATIRARDALVKARTALINHTRNVVKSFGQRLPSGSAASFHRKAGDAIPRELSRALGPVVEMIAELTTRIRAHDNDIELLCEHEYPETQLFRKIAGVGPLTALTFTLVLENPERFTKSRTVGTHIGLTPRMDQSGDQNPQLRITKAGNALLRRLLVGAAQYILGPLNAQDSELREWGIQLAGPVNKQGKHNKRLKKRAVVAVARKLAVLLHTLWTTGQVFDPFYQRSLREPHESAA